MLAVCSCSILGWCNQVLVSGVKLGVGKVLPQQRGQSTKPGRVLMIARHLINLHLGQGFAIRGAFDVRVTEFF